MNIAFFSTAGNVRYLSVHLLSVDMIWQHLDASHNHLLDSKWTYILRWRKNQFYFFYHESADLPKT